MAWCDMMEENRGKSVRDMLPKTFGCLKEQQGMLFIKSSNANHSSLGGNLHQDEEVNRRDGRWPCADGPH
ncbi:hypothetical protein ACTXT7_017566 [Hymenolepis weldensis]